ncbi:hypothetical protein KAZ92_00480 [Candidatus Gracilibacteria bacterium]|nr:hypothetical protein [Candidatus Gracilibacteria bacterium]
MLHPNLQKGLFKLNLNESGCDLHRACVFYNQGLLSFDPESQVEFERYEIDELKFLNRLYFDSGLPRPAVEMMLSKLEKPYSFSFDKIYWDYGSQDWIELPKDADVYIDNNLKDIILEKFDEFLDGIDKEDIEELSVLKRSIDIRLKEFNDSV